MADPAQEAAKEAGRNAGAFGNFIRSLPGHVGRDALDPSSHLVPQSAKAWMGKSGAAAFVGKSFGESLGMDYTRGATLSQIGDSRGFFGAKNWVDFAQTARTPGSAGALGKFGTAFMGSAMSGLSLYWTGKMVAEGYEQNGMMGAAGGVVESTVWGMGARKIALPPIVGVVKGTWGGARYAQTGLLDQAGKVGKYFLKSGGFWRGAGRFLGGTLAFGAGGILGAVINPWTIGIGAAIYAYGEYEEYSRKTDLGIARNKQIGSLELGAPIQDPFGTISTLRQRSLSAIQNTHVNGRMALGNEAALLHSNF
jgi:hypothetical protein